MSVLRASRERERHRERERLRWAMGTPPFLTLHSLAFVPHLQSGRPPPPSSSSFFFPPLLLLLSGRPVTLVFGSGWFRQNGNGSLNRVEGEQHWIHRRNGGGGGPIPQHLAPPPGQNVDANTNTRKTRMWMPTAHHATQTRRHSASTNHPTPRLHPPTTNHQTTSCTNLFIPQNSVSLKTAPVRPSSYRACFWNARDTGGEEGFRRG